MKIRFFAALLVAALSITILSGCAAAPAPVPPQPALTAVPESTVPLAPAPQPAMPAPTEAPAVPSSVAANRITKEEAIAIALADKEEESSGEEPAPVEENSAEA